MKSIQKLILSYQNGDIDFDSIITYFSKTVTILSYKFKIVHYKSDINSYLWEVSSQINVDNFNCDKALYSYIYKALFTYCLSYCNTSKKTKVIFNSDIADFSLDSINHGFYEMDSCIIFDDLISELSKKQQTIISLRYKYCFSDNDIAESLDMSRQAIYKNRKNALSKITKSLSQ